MECVSGAWRRCRGRWWRGRPMGRALVCVWAAGLLVAACLGAAVLAHSLKAAPTPPWRVEALGECVGRADVVIPLAPLLLDCPGEPVSCLSRLRPPLELLATAPAYHCLRRRFAADRLVLVELRDQGAFWRFGASRNGSALLERGLPKLELAPLGLFGLSFPKDVRAFRLCLAASEWRECNRSLAVSFKADHPDYFAKEPVLEDGLVRELAYVRDIFLGHGAQPFLVMGTLLGWYRECGLIPYTTDLDVAARAADYSEPLERALIADRRAKLMHIVGKRNDSLELSVQVRSPGSGALQRIDVFFLQEEEEGDWVGGFEVSTRGKLRWDYPRLAETGLCAGELLGDLFWLPCRPEAFLQADYGPRFHLPHHHDRFDYTKSSANTRRNGRWSVEEWTQVYRTNFPDPA